MLRVEFEEHNFLSFDDIKWMETFMMRCFIALCHSKEFSFKFIKMYKKNKIPSKSRYVMKMLKLYLYIPLKFVLNNNFQNSNFYT